MKKFYVGQGDCTHCKNDGIPDQRPSTEPKWPFQDPGARADAQGWKTKWLEELASESNTIQAQENLSGRKRRRSKHEKTMYETCSVFLNFSRTMYSFGLMLFVVLDIVIPDQGRPVRSPGKSMRPSAWRLSSRPSGTFNLLCVSFDHKRCIDMHEHTIHRCSCTFSVHVFQLAEPSHCPSPRTLF